MIKEVAGDVLLTKAQAIAHGIAPNDHFSNGLALGLRELYPAMYQDFRHFCHSGHPKEGSAWLWGAADGKRIISLFTQHQAEGNHSHPGKASLSNVNHTLKNLKSLLKKEGFGSLAMPRLASGVGGLNWKEVRPLIDHHLGDLSIPVFLYTTFQKGIQAPEDV